MNYKKMKPEEKLRYTHSHMCDAREWLEIALKHIKLAMDDVKFIQSISEYEDTNENLS